MPSAQRPCSLTCSPDPETPHRPQGEDKGSAPHRELHLCQAQEGGVRVTIPAGHPTGHPSPGAQHGGAGRGQDHAQASGPATRLPPCQQPSLEPVSETVFGKSILADITEVEGLKMRASRGPQSTGEHRHEREEERQTQRRLGRSVHRPRGAWSRRLGVGPPEGALPVHNWTGSWPPGCEKNFCCLKHLACVLRHGRPTSRQGLATQGPPSFQRSPGRTHPALPSWQDPQAA